MSSPDIREALATAICTTFDMTGHDHEAFIQPDHCEVGLDDADAMMPFLRALLDQPASKPDDAGGKRMVALLPDYEVSEFGEVLCASCHHAHTDGPWTDRDPDDGTCWSAGSLVCGCPKFITPPVRQRMVQRYERQRAARLTNPENRE